MRFFHIIATILALFPFAAAAQNSNQPYYPVVILDRDAGILGIEDQITPDLDRSFNRALAAVPNPRVLVLNSPGGRVAPALEIAKKVRARGMNTRIRSGQECFSACALIFFSGTTRDARGQLGVHQISSPSGDLVTGQFAIADIIETLDEFGVPSEVVTVMLRTPPDDMYVFSRSELQQYGFTGQTAARPIAPSPQPRPTPGPAPAPTPSPPVASVDLTQPKTWRGYTVTGELVSNGKRWYSYLSLDGRVVFQATSGERRTGKYEVRGRSICYLYDNAANWACRMPVQVGPRVRWLDQQGNYISFIAAVDKTRLGAVRPSTTPSAAPPVTLTAPQNARSVAEAIRPGKCALIVASRRTVRKARDYVRENITDTRYLQGFLSSNGWVAISIGTLGPSEKDRVLSEWKASGRIPSDSFCSTGSKFVDVIDLRRR